MTFFEKTKRFFEPFQSNPLAVILSILKFSCWSIYSLFSVYIIREITRLYTIHDMIGVERILYEFIAFSVVFFILTWFLRTADWPVLYHDMDKWVYREYLTRLMKVENTYLEKLGTGRLIAVITTGGKTWIEGLTSILKEGTKITVVTGFILFLFFSKSFFYGIGFLILFIVLHILVVYFDSFAHRHRRIRTEKKSDFMRQLVRIIMSRNEILQSGKASHDIGETLGIITEIGDANNGINRALFAIFNLVRLTATVLKIALIVFLIYAGKEGILPPADVAGLLALFIIFESFLIDSVEFYKNFTKDFSDIEKLWEVFDSAPKNTRYDHGKACTIAEGDFELKNISFSYNTQENMVFENLSLSIAGGKKTALVGHSGSGKTTLIKMLAGYIEPSGGRIDLDGVDLSEIALKTYYPHIGYLTQDPGVFDATIRENLMSVIPYRAPKKSLSNDDIHPGNRTESEVSLNNGEIKVECEARLIEVLRLAHCDFVFDMEKGIDTEIGEKGIRLSGGQKQRLAIAKIFLKNPSIILLDEPTSALDSFSEEAITIALDELFKGRTVIIVAHRLQTVKKADDIIVLESGKVIERGNHISLVKQGGIYARMLELQSGF